MDYHKIELDEEIRRCLVAHRHAVHPTNIRRWIIGDRFERSLANCEEPEPIQSIKRITNIMSTMNDVEVIRIKGRYYRRFKKHGKLQELKQWIMLLASKIFSRLKSYRKTTVDYVLKLKI